MKHELRISEPSTAIVPVTVRLERILDHRPALVFDAYADVDQRAQWYVSSDEVVIYESHDFRVAGTDQFRCGHRDDPSFASTVRYEHIVDNRCILFTERLRDSADQLLAISVVTWTMAPSGAGTLLAVTDQTTSVVGSAPIEGSKYGYEVMVDRLAGHLADRGG